jgi:hypothetical protein
MGSAETVTGAAAVTETFSGRAQAARLTLLDGYAGAVWSTDGRPRVVFACTVGDGRIAEIDCSPTPSCWAAST